MTDIRRALVVACVDMFHNTLMLMMALRILCVRIRPFRVGIAAFFGTAVAFLAGFARLSRGQVVLLWAPLAWIMMRAAAGEPKGMGSALRRMLTLLACAGFLGGTVTALGGALGSLFAAHALSGILAGAVFVGCVQAAHAAQDTQKVHVRCVIEGESFHFDAIADSGNSLRDYLTHRPVIVTGETERLRNAFERRRTRLIFADTAGGRMMMRMIIPQETIVSAGKKRLLVRAALAISPGMQAEMPALMPTALLEKEG